MIWNFCKNCKQITSRTQIKEFRKTLFAVMLVSTILFFIQMFLEIPTLRSFLRIRISSLDTAEDYCARVKNMTEYQLHTYLASFYNGSMINYGQYKGEFATDSNKIKNLPENCYNNVFVISRNSSSSYKRLKEYKLQQVRKFKNESLLLVDKKLLCGGKRCVMQPLENKTRLWIVTNTKREIDEKLINDEIKYQKMFGLEKGDDDLDNLLFLKKYFSRFKEEKFKVPNIVHFVWFSCHQFKISEYLCVLSTLRYQNPDFILVHGDCEPAGEYWNLLRQAANDKLKFIKRSPPATIFGFKLTAVEHQSDVARLLILLQVGGMYFDTDTMVLKSLDPLRRDHDIVLGKESELSLANGAILVNKNSWFLKRWFQEYQTFSSKNWGLNSVQVPFVLWQFFPDKIHVVEIYMMRPNWSEMDAFHNGLIDWSKHWTVHISTRYMPEKDRRRTIAQFALLETTYGEVARHVLWGNTTKKDIDHWVLHPDFNKI